MCCCPKENRSPPPPSRAPRTPATKPWTAAPPAVGQHRRRQDPQWLRIDLGQSAAIHRVLLNWEAAYAKKYRIESLRRRHELHRRHTSVDRRRRQDRRPHPAERARPVRPLRRRHPRHQLRLLLLGNAGLRQARTPPATPSPRPPRPASPPARPPPPALALTWTDRHGQRRRRRVRHPAQRHPRRHQPPRSSYTDTGLAARHRLHLRRPRARRRRERLPVSTPVTVKTKAGSGTSFVLAAAGDIAERCTSSSSSCAHVKTAKLVETMNPAAVITMGDNQYDDAHLSDFKSYYDKTWGKFKSITHPIPGNHESYDDTPAKGYGTTSAPSPSRRESGTTAGKSATGTSSPWTPTTSSPTTTSPDPRRQPWLKQDLATNTKGCVAAYYHHPRWSSGDHGDNPTASSCGTS